MSGLRQARLCNTNLSAYRGPARLPNYDRSTLSPGIVHIGIGAFHRAHQATYIDDLLCTNPEWGIRAFSLRRPDMAQALTPQDGLYTLAKIGAQETELRIIGAILSVEFSQTALIQAIADARTKLVTITITEKGYEDTGPNGLIPLLIEGLEIRARSHSTPLTILSCDNLPNNGALLRERVMQASSIKAQLRSYVQSHVRFPSSMVDRITPATNEAERQQINQQTGFDDRWPVLTEPFSQWVIEDDFAGPRPALQQVGVQIVPDIRPYEAAKLWLLNGAHTSMAVLGPMLGHQLVNEAVADPVLRAFLDRNARQIVFPALELEQAQKDSYWRSLLVRFDNPNLHHQLSQIAMDSSQKTPLRLIPPIRQALDKGRDAEGLLFCVAAWVAHCRQAAQMGTRLADPMADQLAALAQKPTKHMLAGLMAAGPLAQLADQQECLADMADFIENSRSDELAARLDLMGRH